MDHLSAALKKGGIKDLLAFFPVNKRETKYLEDHFRKEGLPQVADWWTKKQYAALKETTIKEISEMIEREESTEQVSGLFYGSGLRYIYLFLDHHCHQSPSNRIPFARKRAGSVPLARPHGQRRLECQTRPD